MGKQFKREYTRNSSPYQLGWSLRIFSKSINHERCDRVATKLTLLYEKNVYHLDKYIIDEIKWEKSYFCDYQAAFAVW